MDIEFARTLVTVVEAGSFLGAAERLNVTQSTVSARIKELENQLGRQLLDRGRHGAKPTPAGQQFLRHAGVLVRVWQQARQELSLPDEVTQVLNIGAQVSLWDSLMSESLGWLRTNRPEIAIRAELASSEILMRQISDGTLDIAVLYSPQSGPGLVVHQILDDRLVLVSNRADHPPEPEADYVFCDWGLEFRTAHAVAFPDAEAPALTVGAGTVGLAHVLDFGGAVYVPERLAKPFLDNGQVFVVDDAPAFHHPAYVVHPRRDPDDLIHAVAASIMEIARRGT
ncbi:MAG: LysR family transcriptional regulator [Rhodospirillales bacterium]